MRYEFYVIEFESGDSAVGMIAIETGCDDEGNQHDFISEYIYFEISDYDRLFKVSHDELPHLSAEDFDVYMDSIGENSPFHGA